MAGGVDTGRQSRPESAAPPGGNANQKAVARGEREPEGARPQVGPAPKGATHPTPTGQMADHPMLDPRKGNILKLLQLLRRTR